MDVVLYNNYEKVVEQMVGVSFCMRVPPLTAPFLQKAGTARPSFTAKYIEAMYGKPHNVEQERALRLAAAMIYAGEVEAKRLLN